MLRHGDDLLVVTPAQAARAHRGAAAPGQRGRPARPVARRRAARRLSASDTTGGRPAQPSRRAADVGAAVGPTRLVRPFASDLNRRRRRRRPRRRGRLAARPRRRPGRTGCATSTHRGVVAARRPRSRRADHGPCGALPLSPATKPASVELLHGRPGQALAGAGVEDADRRPGRGRPRRPAASVVSTQIGGGDLARAAAR